MVSGDAQLKVRTTGLPRGFCARLMLACTAGQTVNSHSRHGQATSNHTERKLPVTDELFAIEGKVALVTGGTSGIGMMAARALVRRGVRTYITGRDAVASRDTAAQLAGDGGTCTGLAADLSDADGPRRLAGLFAAHENMLHILVNNAGANEKGTIDTARVEDWDLVMNVNLRAAFFLIQQLLPQLR